jgi:hypothetical protein
MSDDPAKTTLDRLLSQPDPIRWIFAGDSITQGVVYTAGWRDYTDTDLI